MLTKYSRNGCYHIISTFYFALSNGHKGSRVFFFFSSLPVNVRDFNVNVISLSEESHALASTLAILLYHKIVYYLFFVFFTSTCSLGAFTCHTARSSLSEWRSEGKVNVFLCISAYHERRNVH